MLANVVNVDADSDRPVSGCVDGAMHEHDRTV